MLIVIMIMGAVEGEELGIEPSGCGEVLHVCLGQSFLVGRVPALAINPTTRVTATPIRARQPPTTRRGLFLIDLIIFIIFLVFFFTPK